MSLRVVRTTIFPHAPESTLPEERRILAAVDAAVEPVPHLGPDELAEAVRGADGLITGGVRVTSAVIAAMPDCRGIVTASVGFDHIDLATATARGIPVAHVPDFCSREVADQTMGLLLATMRKIVVLDRALRAGTWDRAMLAPMEPTYGKTLGIIGLGRIGRQVARRAAAFELRLLAADPYIDAATAAEYGADLVPLDRLLRESDIVSVHTPLTPETRHLLSADEFGVMKPSAIVLNTARGPVVDEAALIAALRAGRLAGTGLDVFEQEPVAPDSPLLAMDNVVVSPHAGGYSEESIRTVRRLAAEEMARILRGERPRNLVNRELLER
ncbi:MAG TPA: C-terminal binding protein [Thermomicrobiaceae bacterium]|nr:C-terminal binding protein [Thermomicrobiaceae bacterium]